MNKTHYQAAVGILAKNETPVMVFNAQVDRFDVFPIVGLVDRSAAYNPDSVFIIPVENPTRDFASAHFAAGAILHPSKSAQLVFMLPKDWEQDSQVVSLYAQGAAAGYFASRIHKVEAKIPDTLGSACAFANAVRAANFAHSAEARVKAAYKTYTAS